MKLKLILIWIMLIFVLTFSLGGSKLSFGLPWGYYPPTKSGRSNDEEIHILASWINLSADEFKTIFDNYYIQTNDIELIKIHNDPHYPTIYWYKVSLSLNWWYTSSYLFSNSLNKLKSEESAFKDLNDYDTRLK